MRWIAVLAVFALVPAWAQIKPPLVSAAAPVVPADKSRVPWPTLTGLERRIDETISRTGGKDPVALLGLTRGLYISGYGVVFTTEVDLVNSPAVTPFHQQITREEAAQVHQRKIGQLPILRQTTRDLWIACATSLTGIPEGDQIVVAVRLLYHPWEDTRGLPGLIMMRADRRALLSGDIQTEEQ